MLQGLLFYLVSFGIIASAFGVIACRSAVYSVLCLVSTMCLTAALFVQLKAFFVATVLVLVYAGAILVLFLFVVMLVDFRKIPLERASAGLSPALAVVLALAFLGQSAWVIRKTVFTPSPFPEGTAEAIGKTLFGRYLLPFELTSFLLLAAVISVVVLAKKEPR